MSSQPRIPRRGFTSQLAAAGMGTYFGLRADQTDAAQVTADKHRPNITCGVAAGDVTHNAATIWSRSDRPSRMIVEVAKTEAFSNSRRLAGPYAFGHGDFTAKLRVAGLPAGRRVFYRVHFQSLDKNPKRSAPVMGQLVTAPPGYSDITFAWSGDTAGQGYGIDTARGGMTSYETIRELSPHFLVHCGDLVYADNPFPAEIPLDDGTIWKNIVTEETSKVAESLHEFRANFRYNLLDPTVRRFNAEIPTFAQWDDHETTNNWYPGEQLLDDDRYLIKSASLLAARARQAFFEYLPIGAAAAAEQRIHRSIPYGPLLELFFLDLRSFRGPNSANRQRQRGPETDFLGRTQLEWLKQALVASQATWKVICSDMPLGMIVPDGRQAFENGANGDGPPLGRELEIASLLQFIQKREVHNTVWLTADVHHAASHYYNPNRAQFQHFEPFWEFVSGPLHAGTFGPSEMDNTFGPEVKFCSVPEGMKPNRPPSEGRQFFGTVHLDGQSRVLTVAHYNAAGKRLWSVDLDPKH